MNLSAWQILFMGGTPHSSFFRHSNTHQEPYPVACWLAKQTEELTEVGSIIMSYEGSESNTCNTGNINNTSNTNNTSYTSYSYTSFKVFNTSIWQ